MTKETCEKLSNSLRIHPRWRWGTSRVVLWLTIERTLRGNEGFFYVLQVARWWKVQFQTYNVQRKIYPGLQSPYYTFIEGRRGLLTSSSKSVINYLPRKVVKAQDIKSLLNFIVPKIAAVMNDFLSPNLQMCLRDDT